MLFPAAAKAYNETEIGKKNPMPIDAVTQGAGEVWNDLTQEGYATYVLLLSETWMQHFASRVESRRCKHRFEPRLCGSVAGVICSYDATSQKTSHRDFVDLATFFSLYCNAHHAVRYHELLSVLEVRRRQWSMCESGSHCLVHGQTMSSSGADCVYHLFVSSVACVFSLQRMDGRTCQRMCGGGDK